MTRHGKKRIGAIVSERLYNRITEYAKRYRRGESVTDFLGDAIAYYLDSPEPRLGEIEKRLTMLEAAARNDFLKHRLDGIEARVAVLEEKTGAAE
jgi:hypothetical protein